MVRPNLHAFLTNFQQHHEATSWIFIDAICINQNDFSERSIQVGLMGDIYSNAEEVIAWVDQACRMSPAHTLKSYDQAAFDRAAEILEHEPRHFVDPSFTKKEYRHQELREELDVLSLLYPIVSQPSWTRLWVVQELLLARRATIHFGSIRVDLSTIAGCLDAEHKSTHAETAESLKDHTLWVSMSAWAPGVNRETMMCFAAQDIITEKSLIQSQQSEGFKGIARVITHFPAHECSVLHDHVFALLGMTRSPPKPDYSTRIIDLYIDVLVEGCMELWSYSTPLANTTERFFRMQVFHQALWKALFGNVTSNFRWERPAVTLVGQEVLGMLGCDFDYDVEGVSLVHKGPIYRNAVAAYRALRLQAISGHLQTLAEQNGPLPVPDAAGNQELMSHKALVQTVESAYEGLLRHIEASTKMGSLDGQVDVLLTLRKDQLFQLADDISHFPTPHETVVLVDKAVGAILRSIGNERSKAQRLNRTFWPPLCHSLAKRSVQVSGKSNKKLISSFNTVSDRFNQIAHDDFALTTVDSG